MHKMISVRMAHHSCVGWMTLFSSTINARRASSTPRTEGAR